MDAHGRKTGGRQKGTPNKNKQALLEAIQEKYPGYHPVLAMASIANDESLPLDVRFGAHKEVAQYVTPKLKAVEMTATLDDQRKPAADPYFTADPEEWRKSAGDHNPAHSTH